MTDALPAGAPATLGDELARVVLEDLSTAVHKRQPGHCIQVTDLQPELMVMICRRLRDAHLSACEAYILSASAHEPWEITPTRLVERRNASQAVLIVFLPPGLRTPAEDSFDVSTFERLAIPDLYRRVRLELLATLAPAKRAQVQEIIRESKCNDDRAVCNYLLAIKDPGISERALGLAIHHLGLVPDPELLNDPTTTRARLDRNHRAVTTLSGSNEALFAKLRKLELREGSTGPALFHFFTRLGTFQPATWLPAVLHNPELTFDKWEFATATTGQIEAVHVTGVGSTGKTDDGYPLFDMQTKHLKVTWETVPPPQQCKELTHFTVEIMHEDAPESEARTIKVGSSASKTRSTTLKDLQKLNLAEGLYYLRVSAWSAGGLLQWGDSETLFFRGGPDEGDDGDVVAPSRTVQQVTSLYEAMIRTAVNLRPRNKTLADLKHIELSWGARNRQSSGRATDEFNMKYDPANQYMLPINSLLRRIEIETLADAYSLGRWELDLTGSAISAVTPTLQESTAIDYDRLTEFLLARQDVFDKIRQAETDDRPDFLVETTDLAAWESEILAYADAFRAVLDAATAELPIPGDATGEAARFAYRQLMSVDTVRLFLPGGIEAYLLIPTHPLKLLWGLQYARATQHWLDELPALTTSQVSWSLFGGFLPGFTSLNLPLALLTADGRMLVNVDNFDPFWSIFVSLDAADVRALVSRIKTLLGSPETDQRFTTISGRDLARKVEQYLIQHPYVTTLRLNAVQPASAAILVDMLLALQETWPSLHYELHLFSADFSTHSEALGAALGQLLVPEEEGSRREVLDAFVTASANVLFPKLVYSKHALSDLLARPEDFEAHITLLFDVFRVQAVTARPVGTRRSNHLYGLLNEYIRHYMSARGQVTWQQQILPAPSLDVNGDRIQVVAALVGLHARYNGLVAALAGDGNTETEKSTPTLQLALGPRDKNLISLVHQVSDWVFTIDRNFGLEYLDTPDEEQRRVYLIDYQPEYLSELGHRLIISTQQANETERIVRPVLARLELSAGSAEARTVVHALQSVSSQLVLKLFAAPQMAHAALGLALARLFLEQAGLLHDMILVPLDTHASLISSARREAQHLGEDLSLQRTDLLLAELTPATATVTAHLIEVKFRQAMNFETALTMKAEIEAQLGNSLQALRRLYDPAFTDPDRLDRLVRSHELSTLLNFYLDRAIRYHLVDPTARDPLTRFLDALEAGYTFQATRTGIVLNLAGAGYTTEEDAGVTYHYLGRDRIGALVATACAADEARSPLPADPLYTTTRATFTQPPSNPQSRVQTPIGMPREPVRTVLPPNRPEVVIVPEGPPLPAHHLPTGIEQLSYDVLLGSEHAVPQYGILGHTGGQTVALDLNDTQVISVFGVQGSGKSYSLGTILEMALMPIPGVNVLPAPLAGVVFHYSKTEDYRPEFVSMAQANVGPDVEALRARYGATPAGLPEIVLLVPPSPQVVEQRQREYGGLPVYPIQFATTELDAEDWRFLMGVMGSDALYIKKMEQIWRRHRNQLSLENLYTGIASANLTASQEQLAKTRLEMVQQYLGDGPSLRSYMQPGRLVIVDLRDPYISADEALGLFVVMLKLFSATGAIAPRFNKLVVFDEAHKYLNSAFAGEVKEVVRTMRHRGTTVLLASQEPQSVPLPLIELSSLIVLHQFSSPEWLKHIQKGVTALKDLTAGRLNMLKKGQAYVWARQATRAEYEIGASKLDIRARVTRHGGGTVTALEP